MISEHKNSSARLFKGQQTVKLPLIASYQTQSLLLSDVVPDKMHCLSRTPRSYLVNSYSNVKEADESKRESYEATWLDLVMETRPEYKYVSLFYVECKLKSHVQNRRKDFGHLVVQCNPRWLNIKRFTTSFSHSSCFLRHYTVSRNVIGYNLFSNTFKITFGQMSILYHSCFET